MPALIFHWKSIILLLYMFGHVHASSAPCLPINVCMARTRFNSSKSYSCINGTVPIRNRYDNPNCEGAPYEIDTSMDGNTEDYIECDGSCTEYIKVRWYSDTINCENTMDYDESLYAVGCVNWLDDCDYRSATASCTSSSFTLKGYPEGDCQGTAFSGGEMQNGCHESTLFCNGDFKTDTFNLDVQYCGDGNDDGNQIRSQWRVFLILFLFVAF